MVAVQAAAVGSASAEEVAEAAAEEVAEATAEEPASEVVTAAALLSAEATEAVPPLVAVMASAEPLQQEEAVSSSMGAHCRCCHRHRRHRSLTRPERRQV